MIIWFGDMDAVIFSFFASIWLTFATEDSQQVLMGSLQQVMTRD